MSQLEKNIEEVELTIAEARKIVEYGTVVRRLIDNPDFKKVVTDDYFVEEAARLALLYSDPSINKDQARMINNDLLGLGAFKRYIQTKLQMANNMAYEMEQQMETLQELHEEDLMGESE